MSAITSDVGGGAPDHQPVMPLAGRRGSDGGGAPGNSDGPPGSSEWPGAPGPPPPWPSPGVGGSYDAHGSLSPGIVVDVGGSAAPQGNPSANPGRGVWCDPPNLDATGDPLAAFVDGLRGLTSDGSLGGTDFAGPIATLLSNGFNADAGVAQLVSALAGLVDGHGAFNATPFATPSDPSPQGMIAAALR